MRPTIREKPHRRPPRTYRGQVLIAITACVAQRHTPFRDAPVVHQFRDSLAAAIAKYGCRVFIYCFMPDHLHMILQGQQDRSDAWRAVVEFKQQTGYWFGRNRSEDSWQKGFYDHIIRTDTDLGTQIRYVADNPVRRGLVRLWSDYPFTGAIGIDLKLILADASTL